MTVAELFVACLEKEGVTHIFGVPGEENESLLFALENSKIQFVPCRHEQGAAFIANVWGRLTGKAGVCLGTLGPGATNLITGVADANLDKAPLVAITAQGGLDRLHHESHQRIDIVNMFRPITKWNGAVTSPEVVTEMICKAFREAEQEKPGATHIELSEDVADREVNGSVKPIEPKRPRRPASDYKAIRQTIELLGMAKKPLVLAGNGAIRKLASKHLTEFAEKHRIPVASTFMGKGALSDRSAFSLGAVGLGFKDFVAEAFEQADLVITVGYDVAEYPPEKWNIGVKKKIIHIDFDPAEVYAEYSPELEVVGDISAALWELNLRENLFPVREEGWFIAIRDRIRRDLLSYRLTGENATDRMSGMDEKKSADENVLTDQEKSEDKNVSDQKKQKDGGEELKDSGNEQIDGGNELKEGGEEQIAGDKEQKDRDNKQEDLVEFTVPGVLHILRDVLDDDALLISDVGTHKMWVARNYQTHCPNGCLISNGMASMGIALPGAIAASLVQPERQIVAAMGDGGFLMNSQELETAKRLGTGFVAIVFNDNDYGLISWKQHLSRQRSVSTRIGNPDIPAYARSFGVEGHRAESPVQLKELLQDHLDRKSVCVIEVPISTHVNNVLVDRLVDYWKK